MAAMRQDRAQTPQVVHVSPTMGRTTWTFATSPSIAPSGQR